MVSRSDSRLTVFRITNRRYPPFDGGGAYKWGSRWCTPGRHIVHASSSYALAVLENLVHFNIGEVPPAQVYVEIAIPERVSRQFVKAAELSGWDLPYPNGVSEAYGDDWYDSKRTAVLIVPSILSPFENNVLINQMHPEVRRIKVSKPRQVVLDGRLQTLVRRS
jgi:RES domain-containing protein